MLIFQHLEILRGVELVYDKFTPKIQTQSNIIPLLQSHYYQNNYVKLRTSIHQLKKNIYIHENLKGSNHDRNRYLELLLKSILAKVMMILQHFCRNQPT